MTIPVYWRGRAIFHTNYLTVLTVRGKDKEKNPLSR